MELEDDIVANVSNDRCGVEFEASITNEDKVIGSRDEASNSGDESGSLDELHFVDIKSKKV